MTQLANIKYASPRGSKNMNQTTKQTKGGFEMKPTRFLIVAIAILGLVATASAVSTITPAGTSITNQAIGNYKDANGNAMDQVESLVVTTTVSQVAGVDLGGNQTANIQSMTSTLYPVTVTNSGNGSDTYSLAATGAVVPTGGTFTIEIYHDDDGQGDIDAGVDLIVSSTTALALGETYDLVIKVTDVSGGAEGDVHTVTLTATSGYTANGVVTDVITLATTIQEAAINGTTEIAEGDETPAPGESITYISCFTNGGTAIAYNPVYTVQMPSNTTLDLNSVSIDGGNNFLTINTASPYGNSFFRGDTLTLNLANLIGGAEVCIQFDAIVDNGLSAGDPIEFPANFPAFNYENEQGDSYNPVVPEETNFPVGGVEVAQTFSVALDLVGTEGTDDTFVGDPGDLFEYPFTVTNGGNGTDNFDLTWTSTYMDWVFYVDTDGDGILEPGGDDADTTGAGITNTGSLVAGGIGYFVAVGTIPAGTADTATDATTFTATSAVGAALTTPVVATGSDTAAATCTAPVLTLVKSVTIGGTEYFNGDANSAAPGDELLYTIIVANSGTGEATTVVVTDAIPANTTYVAESMTVDGVGDDDDQVVTSPETEDHAYKAASSVVFDFDTIPAVTAEDNTDQRILTFKVTVN
jgi:uncharacterized repeat protein (TIGR01451 family)